MADKRIRVLADVSQLDIIREKSNAILRDSIAYSRQYLTVSQEISTSIENQLRLLRERNEQIPGGGVSGGSSASPALGPGISPSGNPREMSELISEVKAIKDILSVSANPRTNPQGDELGGVSGGGGGGIGRFIKVAAIAAIIKSALSGIANTAGSMVGAQSDIHANMALISKLPIIGGPLSGVAGQALSSIANAEGGALRYTQLMGGSINENVSRGLGRNKGLERSLGMNSTEIMQREASLIDAKGGRSARTEREENISLMSAERRFGLDGASTNTLQQSMRFAAQESASSASSVIKSFELVLKDQGKTQAEISATMREYLDNFNQAANNILDKSGNVDVKALTGTLLSIQATTGFQGKQLSRVQQSLSGGDMSQDEVTEAIRLQAARKLNPNAGYSELLSDLEQIQNKPELMREILQTSKGFLGEGEGLKQGLKSMFPGMSNTDIKDLFNSSGNQFDSKFIDKLYSSRKMTTGRYSPESAANTVGTIESASKEMDNRMIGYGERLVESLPRLTSVIDDLAQKMMELTAKIGGAIEFLSSANTASSHLPKGDFAKVNTALAVTAGMRVNMALMDFFTGRSSGPGVGK